MAGLTDLQRALLRALQDEEPLAALAREAKDLPPRERALAEAIDADGFVLSSLLVKKLRFERICRGDAEMERWFEERPSEFVAAFRRYHREVEARDYFPRPEAARFRAFVEAHDLGPRDAP